MSFFDTHAAPKVTIEREPVPSVVPVAVEAAAAVVIAIVQYKLLRRWGAPQWAAYSVTAINSELVQIRRAVTRRHP